MSLLDQVINPDIFSKLDPVVQERITLGVEAGAKRALAVDLGEKLAPELGTNLSPGLSRALADALTRPAISEARTSAAKFTKAIQG